MKEAGHRLYPLRYMHRKLWILKKYDLTIGDIEKLSRLAYHCFLCGKCSKVCPQGN